MALVNKPDESIFASSAKQGEVDNFPDLLRGWGITFEQTQGIPPMEWFNFLFKRLDEKHAYLMQRGLPEWSATQDYTKGSCVQFDGVSYRALKNSKNNSPNESNSQYWVRWGFALSEIARATLTQYGLTQLYTGYNSQREDLALTPKTAFLLKQLIDSNARALGNVIPNSKKSSAVNSNSNDTVATSAAVKTAYDKGVDAKNAADNAQRTANSANDNANARVAKSGDTMDGNLVIDSQSNAWSGIALKNKQGKSLVYEVTPDSEPYFGSMIYRDGAGHNIKHLRLPKRNGEIALKEDVDDKVSKSGDTMTGPLNINYGDYSLINQFNLSGKFARIEVTPDDQSNFYKLSYWSNDTELHSALLPKRGPWKVVAYEDWVNNGYVPRTGDTLINGHPTFEQQGGFITIKSTGVNWAAIDYKVWNSPVPLVTTQAEDLGNFSGAFNIYTTPEGTDYNTDRRAKTAQIHHNGRIWTNRYGWLDEKFAPANDTHKKSRCHNHWFPSHYAGAEVVDLPVNDAGGIRITWMGIKLPNYQPPYVDIYLPMAYSGFAKATVSDDGGATFSYGAEMIGNNIVRVYCKQSVAIGFNLQVIGWTNF
jgi:putative tail fiber protein|uniref:Baseplate structural protein n=1 Tax=Myoviridae sp. ctVDo27 TaxID=2823548 RepID=A0A8S5LHM1_9CAUD|nr:MAG TPA: Baseplate structural protein [Myoviridae sp. ctVDo27]